MSQNSFKVDKSLVIKPQSTAPASPERGQLYVNSTSGLLNYYDGTAWQPVGYVSGAFTPTIATDNATGTATALSAIATGIVELTNASLVSFNNIPAPSSGSLEFILINRTGVAVTVTNNASGTAANRIVTGSGADILLADRASLWLAYSTNEARWMVVGGSGSTTIGVFDSGTASANGAHVDNGKLVMQSASTTNPGMVNNTTQSFSGNKTFTGSVAASNISGSTSGANTGDQTIALTGDVTGSGTGSFAATIANNAVTNAKAAQMATNTIKGNNTGSTANASDLTVTQVQTMLGLLGQVNTVATAGGTTTLVAASKQDQVFTGTSTQTVVLPDATTLSVGQTYQIFNQSTGNLTLNFNGGAAFSDASGKFYSTLVSKASLAMILQTNSTAAGTWAVVASAIGSAGPYAPTVQKFLSGSGTYTTPANVLFINVKMVGGGGGGGGGGSTGAATAGTNGNNSTFGSSLLIAGGGGAGAYANGGAGGLNTINAPAVAVINAAGGGGGGGSIAIAAGTYGFTGAGGNSALGGGGPANTASAGSNGSSNTGGGGSGGAAATGSGGFAGGSGAGAGGYIEAIIATPSATYSYAVGASASGGAGSGGTAQAGGAGGSGYIEVTEYYAPVAALASSGGAYQPTITKLTSGSGTYTTPQNVLSIRVRMVGGGGGGGGSGTSGSGQTNGGSGNASTFGSLLTASAGGGGGTAGFGGGGGAGTINAPAIGSIFPGGAGGAYQQGTVSNYLAGGIGGGTLFSAQGGSGAPGGFGAGTAGTANTGGGGAGGGTNGAANTQTGAGGGGGGAIDAIINNPAASYSYTVGNGGTAGAAGNSVAGGAGGTGYIEITEYYANGSVGTATSITGLVTPSNFSNASFFAPNVQKFTSGSGTYGVSYYFIVSGANASAAATYTSNGSTFTVVNTIAGGNVLLCTSTGAPLSAGVLTRATGTGDNSITFTAVRAPLYFRIRAVGGGGGGSGGGTGGATGTSGGNTTFGGITCNGSGSGGQGAVGSSAGSASLGSSGAIGFAATGNAQGVTVGATSGTGGGIGGASPFGGSGGGSWSTATGSAAAANSGSGGGGGGGPTGASVYCGQGGASGGYVDAILVNPAATYSYAIGAAGVGGAGGTSGGAGGAGGSGYIQIDEFWQ